MCRAALSGANLPPLFCHLASMRTTTYCDEVVDAPVIVLRVHVEVERFWLVHREDAFGHACSWGCDALRRWSRRF